MRVLGDDEDADHGEFDECPHCRACIGDVDIDEEGTTDVTCPACGKHFALVVELHWHFARWKNNPEGNCRK